MPRGAAPPPTPALQEAGCAGLLPWAVCEAASLQSQLPPRGIRTTNLGRRGCFPDACDNELRRRWGRHPLLPPLGDHTAGFSGSVCPHQLSMLSAQTDACNTQSLSEGGVFGEERGREIHRKQFSAFPRPCPFSLRSGLGTGHWLGIPSGYSFTQERQRNI